MNIDQRLEALTQTVELTAALMQDNERRWDKRIDALTTAVEKLTHVAEIQHERITRLERGQQ